MPTHMTPAEAKEKFKDYRAFRMWFREATAGNVELGASIILEMAQTQGELAWLLLTATGDATYNAETFRKAAGIVLATPDNDPKPETE